MLVVNGDEATAAKLARRGVVALCLEPRSDHTRSTTRDRLAGDWVTDTRAWLIGRNLPGMRAADIIRGVDLLAARPDVNAAAISASARDVAGVWLLMAAALDPRIGRIWLNRTPYSLRAALDRPVESQSARRPDSRLRAEVGPCRFAARIGNAAGGLDRSY